MRHKASKVRYLMLGLFVIICYCLAGCGGSGSSSATIPNTIISDKLTVTGSITPPSGIAVSSYKIFSLNSTSAVSDKGEFSIPVYSNGVALVTAVVPGKSFGLMNVVATSDIAVKDTAKKIVKRVPKIVFASQSNSNSIKLDIETTAISFLIRSNSPLAL